MSDRIRLRPAHTSEALSSIYPVPHQHRVWKDHVLRVAVTAAVAKTMAGHVGAAADLSCGDGHILRSIDASSRYFGDYAPGYEIQGQIEDTLNLIHSVDLFVCCETLEHLDDPDGVLAGIRAKTKTLVLSTPVDAWRDNNPEHYWAWSRDGVEAMLTAAGFSVVVYHELDCRPGYGMYAFGIWYCT